MASVEEILRNAGIGDEQVRALDPKMITAFGGVLSQAEQAREQAELAQRSYTDFYENRIAPALVAWDEDKQRQDNQMAELRAQNAFYKTQNEQARASGFISSDAPGFVPRDGQGRYVSGMPGSTPGSPTFNVEQVYQRAGDAIGVLSDIQWEHEKLYGQPLPISPSELVKQADAVRLHPREFASRQFHWEEKRKEMEAKAKEQERNAIVKEVEQRKDREWSERVGNNPNVRLAEPSRYSDASRAVKAGTLRDPLTLNDSERRSATRAAIRADMAEAEK
jgi:hypothetical protein